MTKTPRRGRPRSKPPQARDELTVRVRRLLDLAHDGNVREASIATGLAYATVRDLYTGHSVNPGLKTLKALADAYGVYPGWFTDAKQPSDVPGSGYIAPVRGFPFGNRPDQRRTAIIPYASYPLPRVWRILGDELDKAPATPARPIAGDASEYEVNFYLGEFLLGPLLRAEQESGVLLVLDSEPWAKDGWYDPATREVYVRRLRLLGQFWESVLESVLEGVRARLQT